MSFKTEQNKLKALTLPVLEKVAADNGWVLREVHDSIHGKHMAICDDVNHVDVLIEWLDPEYAKTRIERYRNTWATFTGRRLNSHGIVVLYISQPWGMRAHNKTAIKSLGKQMTAFVKSLPDARYVHSGD